MKINTTQTAKIQAALDQANGKSTSLVGDAAWAAAEAERAEEILAAENLPKKYRRGARVVAVSGGGLANAYGYRAPARTRIELERGPSGWFLVAATTVPPGLQHAPRPQLSLTLAQLQKAAEARGLTISDPVTC